MSIIKRFVKEVSVIDLIFCLLLGLAFTVYPEYYSKECYTVTIQSTLKIIGLFLLFLYITVSIRMIIIALILKKDSKAGIVNRLFNSNNKIYKYRLLIISAIIFLIWLPILICLYPGTAANDTWNQLGLFKSFLNGGNLYDHHPILDTIIMGGVLFPVASISGNWHTTFFTYVIIQAILTSMAFAYSIIYAKEKLKLNNIFIFVFLLIYSILPIFPAIVQNINKDTIFSWIYVIFFIKFIEIIRTNGDMLKNKKSFFGVLLLSIMCCLTKKLGIYVLSISFFILLFTRIKNKKNIIAFLGSILVLMFAVMPIGFKIFNVAGGGAQEKYSMLFQQTARYLKYNGKDVTEEEKELIETVIGQKTEDIVNVYDPKYADPVKGFWQTTNRANYFKYIFVWLRQGLKHPGTYIDATNCMLSGWINFNIYVPLMDMSHHTELHMIALEESVTERTNTLESANFVKNMYNALYNIPIIKYFFTKGLYICLIPIFALATTLKNFKKQNVKYAIVLVPLFLSIILGCFLAPDSGNTEGQRYLYPVIYTSILTIMWTIYAKKNIDGLEDSIIEGGENL